MNCRFLCWFWITCFFTGISTDLLAQGSIQSVKKSIQWPENSKKIESIRIFDSPQTMPNSQKDYLPVLTGRLPWNSHSDAKSALKVLKTTRREGANAITGLKHLNRDFQIHTEICQERKKIFLCYEIIPIRLDARGEPEFLEEFEINFIEIPSMGKSANAASTASYSENSVLADGNWFKIKINKSGIYQLSYEFLQNIGVSVANLNPNRIQIYGNGGGMIAEKNSVERPDDLLEVPRIVVGGQDNTFNPGDKLIFYGKGPLNWKYHSSHGKFFHETNYYDNSAYYFIRINGADGRTPQSQTNDNTPTREVDDYYYRDLHEVEYFNIQSSGRLWYGERVDNITESRNIVLSIPELATSSDLTAIIEAGGVCMKTEVGLDISLSNKKIHSFIFPKLPNHIKALRDSIWHHFKPGSKSINLTMNLVPDPLDFDGFTYLDYIELHGKAKLKKEAGALFFRDIENTGSADNVKFRISGQSNNLIVWEVTDHNEIREIQTATENDRRIFTALLDKHREFVAFTLSDALDPLSGIALKNQNIHGNIGQPDMVIVSHENFMDQANRLADFHRDHDQMDVNVVNVSQVYNEFSSGSMDASAIRDMMRMLYLRAGNDTTKIPEYLILFGDGSFDHRNITYSAEENTAYIPTWQSTESNHYHESYTSDDYYVLLDDNEGGAIHSGAQLLDVSVGRLMVSNSSEAKAVVDKIIHYSTSPEAFGPWRNTITIIGDDEDSNAHITPANKYADDIMKLHPQFNVEKLFFDAFKQEKTAGQDLYPAVNQALNARIFTGALIINYVGHGGEFGWAHERVLTQEMIRSWTNFDKLPLFITATCSFSKYDDPGVKAGGELVLTNKNGGGIALITTVRVVFVNGNDALNEAVYDVLFERVNGEYQSIGNILTRAKNGLNSNSQNTRKFILLGDPAVKLSLPKYGVETTKIKNRDFINPEQDTLKALSKVTIEGEVRDNQNRLMEDFNGIVYPLLFDKESIVTTLRNDPSSKITDFKTQDNIIYKGKATVKSGKFNYTFVVPKDIAYNYDFGKISYYANSTKTDANGNNQIMVGGSSDNIAEDNKGPTVKVYMNDENFAFGGLTNESPLVLVKLHDENGINTSGIAIGHDITGTLDQKDDASFVLNQYYEAALDDYTRGEVQYPLNNLKPGVHEIGIKAWDTYNNSGEGFTEFIVAESAELALDHVLNYPNPFTTHTEFWFEHNQPGSVLQVKIEIFTVTGRIVKTIYREFQSPGSMVRDIAWDGLDDFGDPIGKGVYVYKLTVSTQNGKSEHALEKLVVLR